MSSTDFIIKYIPKNLVLNVIAVTSNSWGVQMPGSRAQPILWFGGKT